MAVHRIHKTKDYSVMSNYHLRDHNLSLKAKGLLSIMLSLPDDWDYSAKGLATMTSNGSDSINSALRELEKYMYLVRTPIRNEAGQFIDWQYDVYENPEPRNPELENRVQQSTKEQSTKESIYKDIYGKKVFTPPTVEEVKAYCSERHNNVNAQKWHDFYTAKGWHIGKAKMKDWRASVRTWEEDKTKEIQYKTLE